MKKSLANGMVLFTIIVIDLLVGMEFDLFITSFPELQKQFYLSPFWVEALLSVNFIGFCLSLFFVGALGDRYGRKSIILLGLVIFIIGSILCLSTASYIFILIGRFLQGIGIAAPSILSFLIVADSYSMKQQQYILAMLNGILNTSVAIAPVAGSYITMYFHWQGNFMALLILGIIVLLMTLIFIPKYKLPEHKEGISLYGYSDILKSKSLMLLIINIVLIFIPYWIFVGMSPLLFMEDLGVSLAHFGYYQGSLALVHGIGCVIFGMIVSKYEQKTMLFISIQIFIISLISIAIVTFMDSRNPLLITLALITFTIAQVIPSTILYPLILSYIPQAKGRISAIIQGSRLIFSALGLQLAAYYYVGSFQNIGIIIIGVIIIMLITMFFIIKNRDLMEFSQE